jgi:hypothetical protein
MRKLIIALALSAVVASAPTVMAGPGGIMNWMEKWQAEQAEQRQIDRGLDKIDRDAASWGVAAGAGAQTMPRRPVSPEKAQPDQE